MTRDEQRAMLRLIFIDVFGSKAVPMFERSLRELGMSALLVHNDDPRPELTAVFEKVEMLGGDDAD